MGNQLTPALTIISAMITPALLIVGSGSLIATALLRLGRAGDRARFLMQISDAEAQKFGWSDEALSRWLDRYEERSLIAERAVSSFFAAVGVLVAGGLAIAVDYYFDNTLIWLPVSLSIIGMALMVRGTYLMLLELRLATSQIREEIGQRRR